MGEANGLRRRHARAPRLHTLTHFRGGDGGGGCSGGGGGGGGGGGDGDSPTRFVSATVAAAHSQTTPSCRARRSLVDPRGVPKKHKRARHLHVFGRPRARRPRPLRRLRHTTRCLVTSRASADCGRRASRPRVARAPTIGGGRERETRRQAARGHRQAIEEANIRLQTRAQPTATERRRVERAAVGRQLLLSWIRRWRRQSRAQPSAHRAQATAASQKYSTCARGSRCLAAS